MKEYKIINLSKSYGTKILLNHVDLSIRTDERIGLIGANGCGKSSFLKILAQKDYYDDGEFIKPNEYTIAYLEQNPRLHSDKTVLESIYDSDSKEIQLLLDYEKMRRRLEEDPTNSQILDQFTRLSDEMTLHNIWEIEVKAKMILSQLGLSDLNKTVEQCSGGERKRIGLAQVLIESPDLLILDEPTNHLDVKTIQWLEKYLANYRGALLLVTHDRYFLDRVVNRIIELEHGTLHTYEGNYEKYLIEKAQRLENQQKVNEKQDKLYKKELEWIRTGAKARTTKQQARIDRFEQLKDLIGSRQHSGDNLQIAFNQQRMGNRSIELEKICIDIESKSIVEQLTYYFVKGDRLGIIGDNGVGKSTFLNTLAQEHSISSGTMTIGQTVRLAYYRQLDQDLPEGISILKYLTRIADQFKREDGTAISAAQLLERFKFPRHTHQTEIQRLSGGERRRLYLLSLLVQQPNVLLLDEPTNDLDIATLTVLEEYLEHFEGIVIIVSHDRYFLDKTVDQLLYLKGQGEFEHHRGIYTQLLEEGVFEVQNSTKKIEKPVSITPVKVKKVRLTYHEKKEWEQLPELITQTETQIASTEQKMLEYATDIGELMPLQAELEVLEEKLLTLYERQEELEKKLKME